MQKNIFREYDIRGVVGTELELSNTYTLGKAIARLFAQKYPETSTVILGRDGRIHSDIIHGHLIDALTDAGLDVIDIGLCPSPVVYFAVHQLEIPAGLMITASHNPKEYNGIKIWGTYGKELQTLFSMYEEEEKNREIFVGKKGSVRTVAMVDRYIAFLTKHFSSLKNKDPYAIIDCASNSAGSVLPKLLAAMGWSQSALLFDTIDGTFPYHDPDPTEPHNMTFVAQALHNTPGLKIGIGLDGDCDRMVPMTKYGQLVPGDKLLAIFAKEVLHRHPGAAVVLDIKGSSRMVEYVQNLGGTLHMVPSGHTVIKQAMKDTGALLAAELSCHFFFKDQYYGYDDGIYAMMRLFALLDEQKCCIEDLLTKLPVTISSPEIRIPCPSTSSNSEIISHVQAYFSAIPETNIVTVDGVKAHTSYGWGLIRASNTQPVLSLRFEADSQENLCRIKNDFVCALTPFFEESILKKLH